ncbi:CPBP family intramembrane glutamic endopeptidase [Lactobacillus melliventris]|uniref:CAAX prenyl protease 2/Lysostaphin resistance protein A-like domain-containing protein n=1 Tax=Lactobacillus melliventris TaxID=1218507 RepID=A0A0F4LEK9_9LACO|nr:CPBP family intramembrane glutamic endopeptidase [Lactobacillus melliventris]KJY57025.1 hypothetical protein JF74_05480 [Lactobacillus melliventris]
MVNNSNSSYKLSGKKWLIILLSNLIAYCCLIMPGVQIPDSLIFDENHPTLIAAGFQILVVTVFLMIQIIGVQIATGSKWQQLFLTPRAKEWLWVLVFFILAYFVSVVSGAISQKLFGAVSGNAAAGLTMSTPHVWLIFIYQRFSSAIQILGEEFLAIMPLLAVTQLADSMHMPLPLFWGNIASALIFALLHLSTYDYNLGYVILGLAFTRLVLNWAFIKTHNIWVSFLVHFLFDTLAFLVLLLVTK